MNPKARKTNLNMALKVAIVESGHTSKAIAMRARIGEVRLSAFVHRRLEPSAQERKALARVLQRHESFLFPSETRVSA